MSLLTRTLDMSDPLDAEIGGKATPEERLEAVAAYVRVCELCGLYRTRRNAVPGEGSAWAKLLVVGEGPGDNEDIQGRPFVGKAGERLDRILGEAEIRRDSVFITNIVKCRACQMAEGKLRNRAPLAQEVNACRSYLVRQIEIIRPRVILCLGSAAANGAIDSGFKITGQRGEWYEGPFGSRLIATFHPAFVTRGGGAGIDSGQLKEFVRDDMEKVRVYLASAE